VSEVFGLGKTEMKVI